jgi:hypothetical protein
VFSAVDDGVTPSLGTAYLFIVIVTFNILILNFIIAILNNTYEFFLPRSKGLFLKQILSIRDATAYDENVGSLLAAIPPLNIHLLVVLPIFLIFKNTKRLN